MDGTLIESAGQGSNALHRESFAAAFKEVFGLDTNIDTVQHHGSTDPLIIYKVLEEVHQVPKADIDSKIDDARQCMIKHFQGQQNRCAKHMELLVPTCPAGFDAGAVFLQVHQSLSGSCMRCARSLMASKVDPFTNVSRLGVQACWQHAS